MTRTAQPTSAKPLRFSQSAACRDFIRTCTLRGSEYAKAYRKAHETYIEAQRIGAAVKE
jgi:hypothetical protein